MYQPARASSHFSALLKARALLAPVAYHLLEADIGGAFPACYFQSHTDQYRSPIAPYHHYTTIPAGARQT